MMDEKEIRMESNRDGEREGGRDGERGRVK